MRSLGQVALCAMVFAVVCFESPPDAFSGAEEPGLTAWWRFEEGGGSTAADATGHGLDGTLENMGPGAWVAGKVGGALRFDGEDDRVDCGDDARLNISDTLTIEMWLCFDRFAANANVLTNGVYRIYHRGEWAGNRIYFLHRIAERENPAESSWSYWSGVRTATELEVQRWYHIAAVMDGDTAAIYVDGVLESEAEAFAGYHKDDSRFGSLYLGEVPFAGRLDEVRIHRRALTPDEISGRAARGYWRLDEGTGDLAADASPYANHGRLTNMAPGSAWIDGWLGAALQFDGVDDYVDCGGDASLLFQDEQTIELWMRLDRSDTSADVLASGQYRLFYHSGDGAPGLYFLHRIDDERSAGDSLWGHWAGVKSPSEPEVGEWTHVLGVLDGEEMAIYVNGRSRRLPGVLRGVARAAPVAPLRFGAAPFRGALDEIRLDDRAISDEQAEQRYEAPDCGAFSNPTGEPIGGGAGYSRILAPQGAAYVVSDRAGLLSALADAQAGQVVYVGDDATIDLTGEARIRIPAGVTLASGRGSPPTHGAGRGNLASPGALIATNEYETSPLLWADGPGVRVTGLRIRGPDPEIGDHDYDTPKLSSGIRLGHPDLEVDNCELWGWSYAAVVVYGAADMAHVHHNYIHHNRRAGLGYGVVLGGASALIEANRFDYCRHHIAGSGAPGTSYEARYNLVLEHGNSHGFDMHGARDFEKYIMKGNWRFDEGEGDEAGDSSIHADNDGVLHGPTWVPGRINAALDFDGEDDYVDCGSDSTLDLGPELTVEAWVRPRSLPEREGAAAVVGMTGGAEQWTDVAYQIAQTAPGALTFSVADGSQHATLDISWPELGAWHHVVGTLGGDVMSAYLDGELVGTRNTGLVPAVTAERSLWIGRWHESFDGVIDEVKLYSAALDADEVALHYRHPDIAGGWLRIHHNTFLAPSVTSIVLRGRPSEGAHIHHNWFSRPDRESALRQSNATGSLEVYNNRYGSRPAEAADWPVAVALADRQAGPAPVEVALDGSRSYALRGGIGAYEWEIGDGPDALPVRAPGPSVGHTFERVGRYLVELTARDQRGLLGRTMLPVSVTSDGPERHLSFWVKDSYRGDSTGRYRQQAFIGGVLVWEDDVAGDEGWQHVVEDVTSLVRGQERVTITLRVKADRGVTDPAEDLIELLVYWDDVSLTSGVVENGHWESTGGWTYSESPSDAQWRGGPQTGDVRSGTWAYRIAQPYMTPSVAGSYAQIEQVVALPRLYVPTSHQRH